MHRTTRFGRRTKHGLHIYIYMHAAPHFILVAQTPSDVFIIKPLNGIMQRQLISLNKSTQRVACAANNLYLDICVRHHCAGDKAYVTRPRNLCSCTHSVCF